MYTGWEWSIHGSDYNPVRYAYLNYPMTKGYSSWDLLTVYAAIMGTEHVGMQEENGTDEVDADGHETWG